MLRIILFSLLIGFASILLADPVNINTVEAEELAENLVGVGPIKTQAIIDYRETNGPFFKPEEITNVGVLARKHWKRTWTTYLYEVGGLSTNNVR